MYGNFITVMKRNEKMACEDIACDSCCIECPTNHAVNLEAARSSMLTDRGELIQLYGAEALLLLLFLPGCIAEK